MGEVLMLPRRKRPTRTAAKEKLLRQGPMPLHLQGGLRELYEIEQRRDRRSAQTFQKIFQRLETLEAVVFAQGVLIAELRGQPLTPEQRSTIASLLRAK